MNVPKIRFSEFNDEWISYKLGDIGEFKNGISKGKDSFGFGYPFVNLNDVFNKNYIDNSTKLGLVSLTNKELADFELKKYDLLFVRSSVKLEGVGLTCLINNDMKNTVYSGFLIRFREKNSNTLLNFSFKKIYFYNPKFRNNLLKKSAKSANVNINQDNLSMLTINIPSILEQQKIGNVFELIDKKIELQSKKIEDLKLFKKGLVSNIFGSFENTTKYKLGELLKEVNIKTKTNNAHSIISSTTKGIFLQSEYFNKQSASDNNIGYKILQKNQLVISPQNLWMGNININDKYNIGIVSPSYKIYDINNINLDLFKEWLKTPRALYEYNMSSEQGASIVRKNLNEDLFKDITIDLPNLQFQNKYGNLFNKLNAKIHLENNKLNNLQELKKGLMQNMFV